MAPGYHRSPARSSPGGERVPARGGSAVKGPPFVQITADQYALPMGGRIPAGDLGMMTDRQKHVLHVIAMDCWDGRWCEKTDEEIADALGLSHMRPRGKRDNIQRALNGRSYRRLDPETGERTGSPVRRPGLCAELGLVEVETGPYGERRLRVTAEWLKHGRGGDGGPNGPAPPPPPSPDVAAGPPTAAEAPTAAETPTAPALATERPSAEVLAEVLERRVGADRAEQARWLVSKLRNRDGVRFELVDAGGRFGLTFRLLPPAPGVEPPGENVMAVLRWLKPEVVAFLDAEKAAAGPKTGETPDPAPRVAGAAEIRARIKGLKAAPSDDDSDCQAVARMMVGDPGFRDSDPEESYATYLGWARQTKDGTLPEAVFLGAFEEACRARIVNRGATMVASVKRAKASLMKPGPGGGWTS